MRHDNQNDPDDPLPFVTLAACTRNVIEFLEATKHSKEDPTHESERDREHKEKGETDRDYIAERLREIERFERRARGLIPQRPRRQRP